MIAQTPGGREILESLDREFARLHEKLCRLIERTPPEALYLVAASDQPGLLVPESSPISSVGENVLRSAAAIEQTFGGITTNLWDDPFEWTLPEHLSTPAKVSDYLVEVEATRKRAFDSFADDACLIKRVAVPSGEMQRLIDLLLETLLRASDYHSRALIAVNTLSGISPRGFII